MAALETSGGKTSEGANGSVIRWTVIKWIGHQADCSSSGLFILQMGHLERMTFLRIVTFYIIGGA
jgi:hypothetical protein